MKHLIKERSMKEKRIKKRKEEWQLVMTDFNVKIDQKKDPIRKREDNQDDQRTIKENRS